MTYSYNTNNDESFKTETKQSMKDTNDKLGSMNSELFRTRQEVETVTELLTGLGLLLFLLLLMSLIATIAIFALLARG